MDKFVCVRLVNAANFDLSLFQFDADLSFAVFFMNADKTIYGRYGTRSDFYEAEREISLESLRKAMLASLRWHENFAEMKSQLASKRGPDPKYRAYKDYPTGADGRQRRGRGNRGGHCTHCHDLRTAEQLSFRLEGKPVPEREIFAWPLPDAVGVALDPKEMATVTSVYDRAPAAKAGFEAGDQIVKLQGQPILSIADVQWVLHNAADRDTLVADVLRADKSIQLKLNLDKGWRRYVDISWRSTTRPLRQRVLGGVEFYDLPREQRDDLGLKHDVVALKAAFVPFYSNGPIRDKDVVIGVDGRTRYMSEGDLIAYCLQEKKAGETLKLKLKRGEETLEVSLRLD